MKAMQKFTHKYTGQAVPAEITGHLNPHRLGVICTAVIKAIFIVQATKQHLTPEQRKHDAEQTAQRDHLLYEEGILNVSDVIDEYVIRTLIPAFIDGTVLSLNLALFMNTSGRIENPGGLRSSSLTIEDDKDLTQRLFMSGAQPKCPVPSPINEP